LQEKYLRATVFCLPSIEEGLALVLNEALSCGLPVIATENTGIEDLLSEGKGGMVVPIRDATAIAGYLTRLAEDSHFLGAKQKEAIETAGCLRDQPLNKITLSETLMQAFQNRSKANGRH